MAILVQIPDLLFRSKVLAVAKHAPAAPVYLRGQDDLVAAVREHRPDGVLLQLAGPHGAVEAIRRLKADPDLKDTPVVGYCRHTDVDLLRAARDAGCDEVLTQGQFSDRLPTLLGASSNKGSDLDP